MAFATDRAFETATAPVDGRTASTGRGRVLPVTLLILAVSGLGGCSWLSSPPSRSYEEASGGSGGVFSGFNVGSTGTVVGRKVEQLRGDLQRLNANVEAQRTNFDSLIAQTVRSSEAYHGVVAAIQARLQLGTTPGNPLLVQQWNQAQRELDSVTGNVTALGQLANAVASSSTSAAYLLESTQAALGLSGGIDQDRVALNMIEDDTARLVVRIDRLLTALSDQISRQTVYVAGERGNLTTMALAIKNGELYGDSIATRTFTPSRVSATPTYYQDAPAYRPGASASAILDERRPLVVIRFDNPNVAYQQALYNAVSKVLEQRPQTGFDLIAVTPSGGTAAEVALNQTKSKQNAQGVLRTLTDMGLPSDRVSVAATTSGEASVPEVRLYIR
ncbi:hypothetical protein L2U69_09385 [Zavarzinia compransoris]|uniref:hypothetical protein n=1 Tax=Zavarzinia marina TaxID=2911065 RepID=UPI001F2347AC|nr:hypothetical protein [Zavarzinia marina]MCF4165854.1 hypothetical protein [Zavarzinia marina]